MTIAKALSSATRGMIIADPGHHFLIGDFRQIESLMIAWLAGQTNVLESFAAGLDSYCVQASSIYNREITKKDKDERQLGKTSILSSQYQGGIAAGVKFAKAYRINLAAVYAVIWPTATILEKERAEFSYLLYLKSCGKSGTIPCSKSDGLVLDVIKQRWRLANPSIVTFWDDLEKTCKLAIRSGRPVRCGKVVWFMDGPFLHCKLPSTRTIKYPFPRLRENRGKEDIQYMHEEKGMWMPRTVYGGLIAENITQAVSRDCMTENMPKLEDKGYIPKLHSHDELVVQVPDDGLQTEEEFGLIMGRKGGWLTEFPLEVETFSAKRYGKAG